LESLQGRYQMIYQQLQTAYVTHRWVRLITILILLVYVTILYWLPGGFPPPAWRLLLQVIPTLPDLWAMQGIALAVPLIGLVLFSLSLLVLWSLLFVIGVKMAMHWWKELRTHASEWQEAEQMIRVRQRTTPVTQQQGAWGTQQRLTPTVTHAFGQPAMTSPSTRMSSQESFTPSQIQSSGRPVVLSAQPHFVKYNGSSMHLSVSNALLPSELPLVKEQHAPMPYSAHNRPADASGERPEEDTLTLPPMSAPYEATHLDEGASRQQGNAVRLLVGVGSDAGRVRSHQPNEDTVLTMQETRKTGTGQFPVGLFAVADGMGGHADGQQASQTTIQLLRDTVRPALWSNEADDVACIELLHLGIQRANTALYQHNQKQEWMGTTITAALVFGATAHIVNVGDSRTYLYRPSQGLTRITRDHSVVEELAEAGIITRDDVYTHPKRNQLCRCLGDNETVELDTFTVPLQHGDVLLLCSDGLWEMVRDPDIEQIIAASASHAEALATMLIQAALNRGGADNVSVVVVCVTQPA
jgi:serine/threonine protein phosphatase PrpC